jgi:hypothetical protein
MIKLQKKKRIESDRNYLGNKIYNLIGVEGNVIKNYVGFSKNLKQRLKAHRSNYSKKFFQSELSFDNYQFEVCKGMVNQNDVLQFDLKKDGFNLTLKCGHVISYSPSTEFTKEDERKLYFGHTAFLRPNKRNINKLTFGGSKSLYLCKGKLTEIPTHARWKTYYGIAEGVALSTMSFIQYSLGIPMDNQNQILPINGGNLISLKILLDSIEKLKLIKLS